MTVSEAITKLQAIKEHVGDIDILVDSHGFFHNGVTINGYKAKLTKANARIETFPYALDEKRPVCLIRYGQ